MSGEPRGTGPRLAALVAALAILAWALYALRSVLTPFAVAFALAYFLNPSVNGMERVLERQISRSPRLRRWLQPRAVAVGVLAVLVTLLLALILLVGLPALYEQIAYTVSKVPDYVSTVRARLEPTVRRLNLRYPAEFEAARLRIEEALQNNLPELLRPVTRLIQVAFSSVLSLILTVLNLLVIPVFALYLLYDMNHIKRGAAELVPQRHRAYVYSRVSEIDRQLSAFARGQITVCLILGTFYAVALSLCGVPMGLLVGLVIGFFNLIPFMSYVVGLPLALLLSWLDDKSLPTLVVVAAVFTFGQFVEGNFITPRIVGESLGLHAVVIMLAVLVGGTLFGFVGMLVAVPVTAALSVFWADLRDLYLRSEFYGGSGPPASPLL